MTRRASVKRALPWLVLALGFAMWFAYLRPPALGGSTAYVFVRGESMEPAYRTGDLVAVRKQSSYEPGDVAAFAVAAGERRHAVVIHRVVAVAADGTHVMRGDNRTEVDRWRPTRDEMVGAPLFVLPAAGRWVAFVADRPLFLGVLCGLAAGGHTFLAMRRDRHHESRPRPGTRGVRTVASRRLLRGHGTALGVGAVALALPLAFLVVAKRRR